MKIIAWIVVMLAVVTMAGSAFCEIKYSNSYSRSDGTQVAGHYRDTSNDGNPYNNANALGLND